MMRLGAAFIAVWMMLIAGSLGAILYLSAGLSGMEASIVAIAVLTALVAYNARSTRLRDQEVVNQQVADLSRGTADLARQVGEIDRRIVAVEVAAAAAVDKARAATAPLAHEIETLVGLVKELAESVAAHDAALARNAAAGALPATVPAAAGDAAAAPSAVAAPSAATIRPAAVNEPVPGRLASGRFRGLDRTHVIAVIASAIDATRVELYLQPIVSLPQRKVRFYEAVARLRSDDGEVLSPDDFLPFAEAGGLMPKIDNLILFRSVQVVRRLASKNRDIGVFCNISGSTLNDPEVFPQLSDFMQANRALAPALVLEFAHSTVRAMGPIETERLAALADLGFSFSLDRLGDLKIDPRELAERSFRFVKAPAPLLLNRAGRQSADIRPADFSDLLGRFGIDLIADKIESETMVVDLLDYDVRFGQGLLFSPPRPVRTEVLETGGRGETARRDSGTQPGLPRSTQSSDPTQPAKVHGGEQRGGRRAGMLAQLARGVGRGA
jgi:cyclic-di-GMP phosphodiesterase TipF (flagellum assembly factor)